MVIKQTKKDDARWTEAALTFPRRCWRSRRPAPPSPAPRVDGPSQTPRGPATQAEPRVSCCHRCTGGGGKNTRGEKTRSDLLQLEDLGLERLELFLVLLGLAEDVVPGGPGLLQLPLVVLHLGLEREGWWAGSLVGGASGSCRRTAASSLRLRDSFSQSKSAFIYSFNKAQLRFAGVSIAWCEAHEL